MQIISIEEHFSTDLYVEKFPTPTGRALMYADSMERLGLDLDHALRASAEERIAAMDEAGIDIQLLSMTSPGAQAFAGDLSVQIARAANERAAAMIEMFPQRFQGLAALASDVPAEAVRELERTVRLGFRGAMVNGHTQGRYLDDEKYWDMFACAEALDVPIYLHPTVPPKAVLDACYEGENLAFARAAWAFSADTGLHFLRLMLAGVFDRFPKLQMVLGHLGEGLPFHLDRLNEHTYLAARRLKRRLTPKEYVLQNVHVTTSGNFSIPAFKCTLEVMGADRVMFAVDWPYEKNTAGVDFLNALPVSEADREKIASGNTRRLFKL